MTTNDYINVFLICCTNSVTTECGINYGLREWVGKTIIIQNIIPLGSAF